MEVVNVKFNGQAVGAVSFNSETGFGAFEYASGFIQSGIELSPIKMPLSRKIYSFPETINETFKGLPGMIADSLPDDFGNAVMNAWIASQGKSPADITPLQRLQYTGRRGMGALTYSPAIQRKNLNRSQQVEIQSLVSMAQEVLNKRENFQVTLGTHGSEDKDAMMALLSVGVSAGGARPKAVLAFNSDFSRVRSGQADAPEGFTHYVMKFDGVSEFRKDRQTFGDPLGYGAMEYVYHLMARACGIDMMPCLLINEGNRRHFITQRFDRIGNEKIHVQTLNGLAHVNYKMVGAYSYAELFSIARALKLSPDDAMQIFKRMVFNVVARNHDDHSKNFSFMLDNQHQWQLAPAYDLAYSYKPGSPWVNSHWMRLNGKRDDFVRDDFYSFEKISPIFTRRKIDHIIEEITAHVSAWHDLAIEHGVPRSLIELIGSHLRLMAS
jgi:serine/threonine-protein kinase HipA